MKYCELKEEELINLFVGNLLETNRAFNFYVNWDNAEAFENFKIELNAMNSLIRCNDFDETFRKLLKRIPTVVATFPYLFALSKGERENLWKGKELLTIVNNSIGDNNNLKYDFSLHSLEGILKDEQIEDYLFFFKEMGLKHLFMNLVEKNIIDYVVGVLVGLDTNGRKNRGGAAFELACEPIIKKICDKYSIKVIPQKKFEILKKYGFLISEDIANRKADFILLKNKTCLNIEVNYFNGAGSKPEEIIDSYINRENDLKNNFISFALITDGQRCWGNNSKPQLLKGFRNISYLMNFNLAKDGMLEEVIRKIFEI